MRDKLRRRYQVHKEVVRSGYFEGEIALGELRRLGDMLHALSAAPDRAIRLEFEFTRNELDLPMISGQLETSLVLECQRCLGAMETPIEQSFRLLVDASDELVRESGLDTLYSDDGYIDIFEVVEDELILGLPLVAVHENDRCNKHWQVSESESGAAAENPFSVLKQLKTTD